MNNGMEYKHKLRIINLILVVLFAICSTCNASCSDMCLLKFETFDEKVNCAKLLCARHFESTVKHQQPSQKKSFINYESPEKLDHLQNILSGKTSAAVGFPKKPATCVSLCLNRYATLKERFSCVQSACTTSSEDRVSRKKKEVEIPVDSYDNDDSESEKALCEDSCRMTFTVPKEVSLCVQQVCTSEETEEENEPEESSEVAGKRPSSACKAMCKAKYFSIQARLTCMDTKCVGMYRSRVGRIKRDSLLTDMSHIQLACFAMCDENHSELKDKIKCIKSHDCRAMYRDRVGRFGKRSHHNGAKTNK